MGRRNIWKGVRGAIRVIRVKWEFAGKHFVKWRYMQRAEGK